MQSQVQSNPVTMGGEWFVVTTRSVQGDWLPQNEIGISASSVQITCLGFLKNSPATFTKSADVKVSAPV